MIRVLTVVSLSLLGASVAGAAPPPDKRPRSEREQAASEAAESVSVSLPADAPRPPEAGQRIRKTQPGELAKVPAAKAIKAFEDLVYTMQKPEASVWSFLAAGEGGGLAPPAPRVLEQLEGLRTHLAAIRSADAKWPRLAEYGQHLAFFERAVATHRSLAEGHVAARKAAEAEANAAHDAAWAARRTSDAGMLHDFHRAHSGQIVFSESPVPASAPPARAVSTVAADAPLFVRAYLAESAWNALHTAGVDCGASSSPSFRYQAFVSVGSDRFELMKRPVKREAFERETTVDLSPAGSLTAGGAFTGAEEQQAAFAWLATIAPRLEDGANTVGWELRAWCDQARDADGVVVARGTLDVRADAGRREALAARGSRPLEASVLSGSELAGLRARVESYFAGKGKALRDFRVTGQWQPVRDAAGHLTHRAAESVALVRVVGGTQCELVSLLLEEPHDGQRYGPTLNFGVVLPRPFVCQAK